MYLTLFLIIFTSIISIRGFSNDSFRQRFSFNVGSIQKNKEYLRLLSSGFFHVNWPHLLINMITLFGLGLIIEAYNGSIPFLIIFLTSLVGGNVLSLLLHKHDPGYTSVGASGAISGLVFATIALHPETQIFFVPCWIFGIAYIGFTLYAIRSQKTDIGHAAHLGGGLIGMLVALLMFPGIITTNWLPIVLTLVPAAVLIFIMIYRPNLILIDRKLREEQLTIDDRYNATKKHQQTEIDRILEKINQTGIDSLSKKEKQLLEDYSRS